MPRSRGQQQQGAAQQEDLPFGRLPFDLFALHHWDFDAPENGDADQWDNLVQMFLESLPRDRHPYELASMMVGQNISATDPTLSAIFACLTPENAARIRRGQHAAEERIQSVLGGGSALAQMQYQPEFEGWYQECDSAAETAESSAGSGAMLEGSEQYEAGPSSWMGGGAVAQSGADWTTTSSDAGMLWVDAQGHSGWHDQTAPEELIGVDGTFMGGYVIGEKKEKKKNKQKSSR